MGIHENCRVNEKYTYMTDKYNMQKVKNIHVKIAFTDKSQVVSSSKYSKNTVPITSQLKCNK